MSLARSRGLSSLRSLKEVTFAPHPGCPVDVSGVWSFVPDKAWFVSVSRQSKFNVRLIRTHNADCQRPSSMRKPHRACLTEHRAEVAKRNQPYTETTEFTWALGLDGETARLRPGDATALRLLPYWAQRNHSALYYRSPGYRDWYGIEPCQEDRVEGVTSHRQSAPGTSTVLWPSAFRRPVTNRQPSRCRQIFPLLRSVATRLSLCDLSRPRTYSLERSKWQGAVSQTGSNKCNK